MSRYMPVAERNRRIKKALSEHFGQGKVKVRGSRGTAYGWVSVYIDHPVRDLEHRRELESEVWKILRETKLNDEIGTYGYDDPGSDYGYGSKIHISIREGSRPYA